MSNKTRSILKITAIILAALSVLMHLHVIIIPAIAIYQFWILAVAFVLLLLGSK